MGTHKPTLAPGFLTFRREISIRYQGVDNLKIVSHCIVNSKVRSPPEKNQYNDHLTDAAISVVVLVQAADHQV
jgi:hypothetical protein